MPSPRRSKTFNEAEPVLAPRLSSSVGVAFQANNDGFPVKQISSQTTPLVSAIPTTTCQVVLITGCSKGGIGHALCIEFAKKGCRVFGTVRRMEALADFQGIEVSPGTLEMLPMDVTERESIKRAVRAVMGRAGRIDILVNNAGIGLCGGVVETELDQLKAVFDTNVIGLVSVSQEVVPYMAERGQGKIINLGSMLAYVSFPWSGAYCASKSAVRAITSSMRMELAPLGIQVVLVSAGSVKSNLNENMYRRAALSPPKKSSIFSKLHGKAPKPNGQSTGTETDLFASSVVSQVLVPNPEINMMMGKWWWVILVFLQFPEWLIEWIIMWRYSLHK